MPKAMGLGYSVSLNEIVRRLVVAFWTHDVLMLRDPLCSSLFFDVRRLPFSLDLESGPLGYPYEDCEILLLSRRRATKTGHGHTVSLKTGKQSYAFLLPWRRHDRGGSRNHAIQPVHRRTTQATHHSAPGLRGAAEVLVVHRLLDLMDGGNAKNPACAVRRHRTSLAMR